MDDVCAASGLPPLLRVDEVSDLLRVSRKVVWRMIRDGELPATKAGKEWRIPRGAVAELLRAGTPEGAS